MSFLYPSFLWLLIPLILFLWSKSNSLLTYMHIIILLLIVLSLSRPVQKQILQNAPTEAKDIIIALDASYSMRATDIKPTRYDFAKETINALLKDNPTDNIMLIAFTSNPLLLSPPTTDHALIRVALESLNPNFILTKGTSLENLFKKIASFHQPDTNLILITDGGEEKDINALSQILKKSNVRLTILALGTKRGITILNDKNIFLKDKEGNLIVSRINPLLESLALVTKGSYVVASSTPISTAKVLNHILKENHTKYKNIKKMQYHYLDLYQLPLFLAVILFLMVHTQAIKYLIVLFTFLGININASILDDYHLHLAYKSYQKKDFNTSILELKKIHLISLQSQVTLANNYYQQKKYKKAIKIYNSIYSTSASIKQQLYYNIANAYVHLAIYSKAKIYYTKALQLDYDKDAKFNLHLISRLEDKDIVSLGIAHPKSQNNASSQSQTEDTQKVSDAKEQSHSGSGSSGNKKNKEKEKNKKLLMDKNIQKHPLSSKVYDLINKGYIHETKPW